MNNPRQDLLDALDEDTTNEERVANSGFFDWIKPFIVSTETIDEVPWFKCVLQVPSDFEYKSKIGSPIFLDSVELISVSEIDKSVTITLFFRNTHLFILTLKSLNHDH